VNNKYIFNITNDINNDHWDSYVKNFNLTFSKEFDLSYFKNKYSNSVWGFSFHAFLINKNDDIVGALSVIPYEYLLNNGKEYLGSVVDGFVITEYRNDPMCLKKLFNTLEPELLKCNIKFIYGIPNKNASDYWKKFVNWKEIGKANYYILPVNLSSLINMHSIKFVDKFWHYLIVEISKLSIIYYSKRNKLDKYRKLKINKTEEFIKNRFLKHYKLIWINDKNYFIYSIYSEKNKKVCYIIDLNEVSKYNITFAVHYLIENIESDMIMYIGNIDFIVPNIFKVPSKFEPRELIILGKFIKNDNANIISNIDNWEFNLMNIDQR